MTDLTRRDVLKAAAVAALPVLSRPVNPTVIRLTRGFPVPLAMLVARTGEATAITRTWPKGQGPCGRCPQGSCQIAGGACLVVAPHNLTNAETVTYPTLPDGATMFAAEAADIAAEREHWDSLVARCRPEVIDAFRDALGPERMARLEG
jgi:hypothetical protein